MKFVSYFVNEHSIIWPNWSNDRAVFWVHNKAKRPIFSSFFIFCCYFTRLRARELSQQNIRNSGNIGHIILRTVRSLMLMLLWFSRTQQTSLTVRPLRLNIKPSFVQYFPQYSFSVCWKLVFMQLCWWQCFT